MKITRLSPFTNTESTMDIPVTQEQLDSYVRGNQMIQDAFPMLSADQREFILTGITKEQWEETFDEGETDEPEDNEGIHGELYEGSEDWRLPEG